MIKIKNLKIQIKSQYNFYIFKKFKKINIKDINYFVLKHLNYY